MKSLKNLKRNTLTAKQQKSINGGWCDPIHGECSINWCGDAYYMECEDGFRKIMPLLAPPPVQ